MIVVRSVSCMNSALFPAVVTLNSSMDSTDGNSSREGPPKRTALRRDAVDRERRHERQGAGHGDRAGAILLDALSQRGDDDRARVVCCAKVQRKLVDVFARPRVADRGAVGFDDGLRASHLDALGRTRDLQPHVDAHDLPREQLDFANVVLKSLNADRHQIAAGVEVQDLKASLGVADPLPLDAGRQARREHVCAGHDRRRCVTHGAGQRRQCGLCTSVRRGEQQARDDVTNNNGRSVRGCSMGISFDIALRDTTALYGTGVTPRCRTNFDLMTSCSRYKTPLHFAIMQRHRFAAPRCAVVHRRRVCTRSHAGSTRRQGTTSS